jgi:hypothetical protein
MVVLSGTASAAPPQPGVAVVHQLDPDPPPTTAAPSPQAPSIAPAGTASIHRLDDPADGGPPPAPQPQPAAGPGDETWTVEPGESFWLVARDHLVALTGTEPTEREVGRYWLSLIDANRDALLDPLNPDLLFPSAVLVLPPA